MQADWSLVTFAMQREDESEIDVELIRPLSFWQQQDTVPDASVFLEFPEFEVFTHANVRNVQPCTPVVAGPGNIATARIITLTPTEMVNIKLETGETFTGTLPHPKLVR